MPDTHSTTMQLHAHSPLKGAAEKIADTTLVEITDRAIVSLAIPHGGDKALDSALQSALKLSIPAVGQRASAQGNSSKGKTAELNNAEILSLQSDQLFLVFDYPETQPVTVVKSALSDNAYLTDQSDSWVVVQIEGALTVPALERICPLDLDDKIFTTSVVSRTVMEHLSVIIQRDQANSFRLFSPRSSAASLWHAVHTSILNVSE